MLTRRHLLRAGIIGLAVLLPISDMERAFGSARGREQARTPWRIGLASRDITPGKPIWLHGYLGRKKPSDGVLDPIHAKALALKDARGKRAVLLTVDLCVLRSRYAEAICRAVGMRTGLRRGQILLNVSHTHSAPVVGLDEPKRFDLPPEQRERVKTYSARLQQTLAELAEEALRDLRPARLAFGTGQVDFVMNRREITPQGVRLGVNSEGHVDDRVPVLRVESEDGRLRAVLFGCACHNTTLRGRNYKISGDYAGWAQRRLERELPGVQAMFLTGCGADANPHPRGGAALARRHGQSLAEEVIGVVRSDLRPVHGPLTVLQETARLPLAPAPARDELERRLQGPGWRARQARRMLEALDGKEGLPEHYAAPVAVWQFGRDLTFIGLPGEVVSDYVPRIAEALPERRLWIAGYCNDVFGYLPSARDLDEGGYETKGLIHVPGRFATSVERELVHDVRELVLQADRRRTGTGAE